MKISVLVSLPDVTKPYFSVFSGDIKKSFDKVSALGFDGIEIAIRDPRLVDISMIQDLLNKNKLELSCLNTGQVAGLDELFLFGYGKDIFKKTYLRLKDIIDLASELNTMINIGRVRGMVSSSFSSKSKEYVEVIKILSDLVDYAFEHNVRIALEPLNRYETNFINNINEGVELLSIINKKNVGLLIDTFHMNIEESNYQECILGAVPKIFMVHIADSNRKPPGAGHINFKQIIFPLLDIDFKGYISGEMFPFPDSDTAAYKTINTIRELINQYSNKNI